VETLPRWPHPCGSAVVWCAVLVMSPHEPPRASLVSQRLGVLVGHAQAVRAPRRVAPRGAHGGRACRRLVVAGSPPAACHRSTARPGADAGAPEDATPLDAPAMGLRAAAPADREALCAGHGSDAMIAETRVLFLARWHLRVWRTTSAVL
jgi:hypothetical protein